MMVPRERYRRTATGTKDDPCVQVGGELVLGDGDEDEHDVPKVVQRVQKRVVLENVDLGEAGDELLVQLAQPVEVIEAEVPSDRTLSALSPWESG